ncbi:HAD family phosphatase [Segetibacter sp.]|jgi:beta-phosphoglucomutase|uniref:HAD family hydrolase n=1 Tax=Segetibacter sp. TaxID=2231182 RepID=UPI00260825B2|nr:HAD family phosphatase [Segetibacter sp.]MCW3080571.1 HAD-superfamily hydrolase [Segetibacter sp.]
MNKAILFDLNGTMIDDMEYHARAWFNILNNDLKANLSIEAVRKEMYGKNSEVLIRVFGDNKFTEEEMDALSIEKEKRYQKEFFPQLKLIDGLNQFLAEAKRKHIKMAIASAAIPFNIDFVLDNLHIRHFFSAIVSADDVTTSKPHPETFLKAATLLNTPPENCFVFEDAPKGVEAAQNAGMKTVVLTTMHEKEAFSQYNNIVAFVKDYADPFFSELLNDANKHD